MFPNGLFPNLRILSELKLKFLNEGSWRERKKGLDLMGQAEKITRNEEQETEQDGENHSMRQHKSFRLKTIKTILFT